MVIHALRRLDGDSDVRVAVVAGRPVGKAVARNRAKRRVRAAVRQARLPSATDLVIDARQAVLTAPFAALQQDLERLSARALERGASSAGEAGPGSAEATQS